MKRRDYRLKTIDSIFMTRLEIDKTSHSALLCSYSNDYSPGFHQYLDVSVGITL